MRLKTFYASSVPEAMKEIRHSLGPDAVIVSSHRENGGGVKLIAALEEESYPQKAKALFGTEEEQARQIVQEKLTVAGADMALIQTLLKREQKGEAKALLIGGLKELIRFYPLLLQASERTFLFVGTPGCGKTTTLVKLALQAKLLKKNVGILTLDVKKTGALEQLNSYAELMQIPSFQADVESFPAVLKQAKTKVDLLFVDTPAMNPFSSKEVADFLTFKNKQDGLEPLWVLGAETEHTMMQQMADVFVRLGCVRCLVTKRDIFPSLGGILSTVWRYQLALAQMGASPLVTEEMGVFTPENITDEIMKG